VLMTKFGKAGKTGLSDFVTFRIGSRKELNMKIQVCLKHGKGKDKHQGTNPCVDDQI
jgi:hypothetical protein